MARVRPAAIAPGWLREVPFAHRGLHGDGVVENTLTAFEAAAAHGYGVELDVLLSRDGVPVVAHDRELARLAGLDARVGELSAAQLGALRLLGADAGIPTLAEALAALRGVPAMLEIKARRLRPGRLERRVATLVAAHAGPVCVASFNPATLRWFRRAQPGVVRVLTATSRRDPRLPRRLAARLAQLRDLPAVEPHAVSYELAGLPNPATGGWRRDGGVLIAWTAVGRDGLARARSLADNVIFEDVLP